MTPAVTTPRRPHGHHHTHDHAAPQPHSVTRPRGQSPTTALVLGVGPRLAVAAFASTLLWLVVVWALS